MKNVLFQASVATVVIATVAGITCLGANSQQRVADARPKISARALPSKKAEYTAECRGRKMQYSIYAGDATCVDANGKNRVWIYLD